MPAFGEAIEDADPVEIEVVVLDHGLGVPGRAMAGDAGVDLRCCADVVIFPGARALVGTGVRLAVPPGYVGLIHPRSGLAARTGLTVLNAPGTVDSGYRGEVRVCLVNHDGSRAVELCRGDRIAQLVVQRVAQPRFRVVERLGATERGERGFGSSGGQARLDAGPAPDEPVEPPIRATDECRPRSDGTRWEHHGARGNTSVGRGREGR